MFFGWEQTDKDNRYKVYIDIPEIQAMEEVEICADDPGNAVSQRGQVAVCGIHFETDTATSLENREKSLKVMVTFLQKHSVMRVLLAGHTTIQGPETTTGSCPRTGLPLS